MTPNRSGSTKQLPSILAGLALIGAAGVASAQPTGPEPAPPPDPATEPTPATEPAPAAEIRLPEPPPEEPTPAPEPPPPPEKLKAGKEGYFQPSILMQGWYFVDHAGTDTTTNAFRLRRAEIHVKGQIVPDKVGYEIHIDPAKVLEPKTTTIPTTPEPTTIKEPQSAISALQDFYITYMTEWVDVSLGQFKIPVSWEGYNSSGKLLFPERAAVSKAFGDKRDLGVRLAKTFDKVGYSAGVFNGAGLNTPENNDGKDVGLRAEYYPVKGATVAAVGYASIGNRDDTGAKDRWELDGRYEHGPYLFQGEAILARDVNAAGDAIMANGFYAAGAYRLPSNIQPALRVGMLDPDQDTDSDAAFTVDAGVNYYLRDHQAKLQLAYGLTLFQDDTKSTDHLVILAAQVSY